MILIVDFEKRTVSAKLFERLVESGVPCIYTDTEKIRKYPSATAVIAFVRTEDMLNRVCVKSGKIPVLAINESGSRIYNNDVLFFDEVTHGDSFDFLISYLHDKFGFTKNMCYKGDLSVNGSDVRLEEQICKFTATERRIIVLMIYCSEKWVSEDEVVKTCFSHTGKKFSSRVSVHICNINKKSKSAFGIKLIECKRGVGYTLCRNV